MKCSDWPGLGQVPISWALEWVLPQTGLGSREQDRKSERCYQQKGCVDPGQANPRDVQCQRVFPTYLWTGRGRLEDEERSSSGSPLGAHPGTWRVLRGRGVVDGDGGLWAGPIFLN